jgi:hypothetical protein
VSSPYASTQFTVVPEERLFQIFALHQLPYTGELAKHQSTIVYAGLAAALDSQSGGPGREIGTVGQRVFGDDSQQVQAEQGEHRCEPDA